ncbi:HAD hydrolase family protein [Corynebacterium poyangense]|uniref:HAD hydrolase family protein n=1 Tax=Corynebacterium poyangense TaxID=2684405 RepID=A0A7H0SRR7_9CORY|nr:1-acyl-sn-glycerol-3-phosphate acyltransferase [Corynebacterium poyangense]QNQ91242.1 HAD hydrolase family protein [Corynebacterium poyangense]
MPKDVLYRGIVESCYRIIGFQGTQLRVSGEGNIPAHGGAVLVLNHTGYLDFVFGGLAPRTKGRLVRYMSKSAIFRNPMVGWLMRSMGHISVDRIDGQDSFQKAVDYARRGELVGIFPEGTISRSFEIKPMRSGAVRIAQEAGVPIVPMVLFGSQRFWTKGHRRHLGRNHFPLLIRVLEPWTPDPQGDPQELTEQLRATMQECLNGLWADYQREFGDFPAGANWVPARFGGSAPTVEEAQRADKVVEDERHRVRRLSEDLSGLGDKVQELSRNVVSGAYNAYGQAREKLSSSVSSSDSEESRLSNLLLWVKSSLDELAQEGGTGVKEGAERISGATEQLRRDATALYAQLAASGWEKYDGSRLEEALTNLAAQTRQILDRLPHRPHQRLSGLPQVVCLDVAGTLCDDQGQISDASRDMVREFVEHGVRIVLTTESGIEEVRDAAGQLGVSALGVAANGAVRYDVDKAEVLETISVTPQLVAATRAALTRISAASSLRPLHDPKGQTLLLRVSSPDLEPRNLAEQLEQELDTQAVVTYTAEEVQVGAPGADKAAAVGRFIADLGFDAGATMAVGDSYSDAALLRAVEIGVAMGSAPSEVIRSADWTTADVAGDGVAEVLRSVFEDAIKDQENTDSA